MLAVESVYFLGWNWFDWMVVLALLYGIWSGMRRGFVGELVSAVGVVLMVALAVSFYEPVGNWVHGLIGLDVEQCNLMAFVVISVLVYVIAVSIQQVLHDKMKRGGVFSASLENVGGALCGVIRMLGVMVAITLGLCLIRSEYWHKQIGRESQFGEYVTQKFPPIAAMVDRSFKEKMWFMEDIKRRQDPDLPSTESGKK